MSYEYRVRWHREGREHRRQIFQTEKAARAKAQRLIDIDEMIRDEELPHELEHLYGRVWGEEDTDALPPLKEPPVIERREVGDWVAA
jgi:hypothetical protein